MLFASWFGRCLSFVCRVVRRLWFAVRELSFVVCCMLTCVAGCCSLRVASCVLCGVVRRLLVVVVLVLLLKGVCCDSLLGVRRVLFVVC